MTHFMGVLCVYGTIQAFGIGLSCGMKCARITFGSEESLIYAGSL